MMLRNSPSFKEFFTNTTNQDADDQDSRNREYYDPVRECTTLNNFRFPPPLCIQEYQIENNDRDGVIYDRLHVIHEVPRMNTSLYCLLSQYNPWLDCEMTREKRAFLKPRPGEMCCAVYSSSQPVPNFFRNETVMDIVNLYLWPLLHSRADEVVACRTFADWRRLFSRTISLAFPDYDYWISIATATSSSAARFIPVSDQRRTARILKYLTPARVLYLLTIRASLWPYGQTTPSSRSSRNSGLCSIKPKIKEYNDKMTVEWLVSADFLRKMKRVHLYFTPLITSVASSIAYSGALASASVSVYDTDECDE
jgi:hypothetical protein